ncbi:Gp15 family bacteriophage protein [Bacillus sp. FSL W8-1122]
MRLNDPLVTSFEFEGEEYSIDLAFDNVLDVFDVMQDKLLRDHEKIEICLELLLGDCFKEKANNLFNLWSHIYDTFIHREEREIVEYDLQGNPLPVEKEEKKRLIDIDQDAEYIFASFKQAYGINLIEEQGKLHWNEFQALLHGLPHHTIMKRVIEIRDWEPSKGDSAEYKRKMEKAQKRVALPEEEEEDVD